VVKGLCGCGAEHSPNVPEHIVLGNTQFAEEGLGEFVSPERGTISWTGSDCMLLFL
jgi:hypothetical protein